MGCCIEVGWGIWRWGAIRSLAAASGEMILSQLLALSDPISGLHVYPIDRYAQVTPSRISTRGLLLTKRNSLGP